MKYEICSTVEIHVKKGSYFLEKFHLKQICEKWKEQI